MNMLSISDEMRLAAYLELSQEHIVFACHAAVPTIFSVDLLYQILGNFDCYQQENTGKISRVPYIVVSDLLLSSFVSPVGFQLYKLDQEIRSHLQQQLIIRFGKQRQLALAAFLKQYAMQRYPAEAKHIRDLHLLTAEGILDPERMQKRLAEQISGASDDHQKINYLTLYFNLSEGSTVQGSSAGYITLVHEPDGNQPGVIKLPLPNFLKSKIQLPAASEEPLVVYSPEETLALELIRQCLDQQNEELSLGNCGLTDDDFRPGSPLDRALRTCVQLRVLILSNHWYDALGQRHSGPGNGSANALSGLPPALTSLLELRALYCGNVEKNNNWNLSDIQLLSGLKNLSYLDLGFNVISDLRPLSALTDLETLQAPGNKITDMRPLAKLTRLRTLNLSENGLANTTHLGAMSVLENLDLSVNQIKSLENLYKLKSLKVLNLSYNRITFINPIRYLTDLSDLALQGNLISTTKGLRGLTSLKRLNLSHNRFISFDLPAEECPVLESLSLRGNRLSRIAGINLYKDLYLLDLGENVIDQISELIPLNKLSELYLDRNEIVSLQPLKRLHNISVLHLDHNRINQIKDLKDLYNLKLLQLGNNEIRTLPKLAQLTKLLDLDLSANKLKDIAPLAQLRSLKRLYLPENQIKSLNGIQELSELTSLDLRSNQIEDIQPLLPFLEPERLPRALQITLREKTGTVNYIAISDNTINKPPIEVVRLGNEAVLDYFRAETAAPVVIREQRIIMIGPPGSGKTDLIRRFAEAANHPLLINTVERSDKFAHFSGFDDSDGHYYMGEHILLEINEEFSESLGNRLMANENAVYILVLDHLDQLQAYWLNYIRAYTFGRPVFVALNDNLKSKGYATQAYDELLYKLSKGIYYINRRSGSFSSSPDGLSSPGDDFKRMREDILKTAGAHNETNLKPSWLKVYEDIRRLRRSQPFLDAEEYRKICEDTGLNDSREQLTLSQLLQELGTFTDIKNDKGQTVFTVIQPDWITGIIKAFLKYRPAPAVLTEPVFEQRVITAYESNRIAARARELLLQLDISLKVSIRPNRYCLIPEFIHPTYQEFPTWEASGDLVFRYHYDLLPELVYSRLMARFWFSIDQEMARSDGFRLNDQRKSFTTAKGQVTFNQIEKEIVIFVNGDGKTGFARAIADTMEELHRQSYPGPGLSTRIKINSDQQLGCLCPVCMNKTERAFYVLQMLLDLNTVGRQTLLCPVSSETVGIIELCGNYGMHVEPLAAPKPARRPKHLVAFYAGVDRGHLNAFADQLNVLRYKNLIGSFYFHELNATDDTQAEIPGLIDQADIACFLFSQAFLSIPTDGKHPFYWATEKKERALGFRIVPVLLNASARIHRSAIANYTAIPYPDKALENFKTPYIGWYTMRRFLEFMIRENLDPTSQDYYNTIRLPADLADIYSDLISGQERHISIRLACGHSNRLIGEYLKIGDFLRKNKKYFSKQGISISLHDRINLDTTSSDAKSQFEQSIQDSDIFILLLDDHIAEIDPIAFKDAFWELSQTRKSEVLIYYQMVHDRKTTRSEINKFWKMVDLFTAQGFEQSVFETPRELINLLSSQLKLICGLPRNALSERL